MRLRLTQAFETVLGAPFILGYHLLHSQNTDSKNLEKAWYTFSAVYLAVFWQIVRLSEILEVADLGLHTHLLLVIFSFGACVVLPYYYFIRRKKGKDLLRIWGQAGNHSKLAIAVLSLTTFGGLLSISLIV